VTVLLSLYPRAWRERYEDEFIALLEARPPDVHDKVDILRGAVDARLHPQPGVGGSLEPQVPIPYNGPWPVRRAGALTLVGGFLYLFTIWLVINGPLVPDGGKVYRDGSAGFATLFLSVVLLLLGVWAVAATLPSTSRVARAAAVIAAISGLLWAVAPWMFQFGAALLLGIAIVAVEAARTGRWRRTDAVLLVGAIVVALGLPVVVVTEALSADALPIAEPDIQFLMFLLFSPIWFATAHALLRPAIPVADPVRNATPVA
jgi:hypothetical protein